jgi:hypothetical protein
LAIVCTHAEWGVRVYAIDQMEAKYLLYPAYNIHTTRRNHERYQQSAEREWLLITMCASMISYRALGRLGRVLRKIGERHNK